ncbi:di-trans,poly-cis-decaprenylcistransferase [Candidatus Woesebacteria bacterium RIFOXYB1_FULL_38_16]|uniref:Isoprenyl transferase n=1 Tax=Candidatus Woesebacteria bacterium RIFOXYB1_FULL_38_16 TaxID=1802538 RepID=A0A1F8CV92_9BACT|nr:MAG: di-trans,poly-cis-decaprenylcistransferase [Candidatus Woesebacteria bacterium RIFOXYB1_FULL_38_16]
MPQKTAPTLPSETRVPDHLAIIPDGNRRWARARGLHPSMGHRAGAKRVLELTRTARKWGIHTVTFWGLSTENWRERNPKEVGNLVKIILEFIDQNLKECKEDGVKIIHLGRKDRLPNILLKRLAKAEAETAQNTKYIFNLALDYGGQDEIVRAVKALIADNTPAEKIDIKLLDSYMDTASQPYPYPDLIIRTSGEQRLSGLLLWQSHYSEMYWEEEHLPGFTPLRLKSAILDYSRRRRRFGGDDAGASHLKFKPEVSAKFELDWWRLGTIPEGVKFHEHAINHLKETYGLSKHHAKAAAYHLVKGIIKGNKNEWQDSAGSMLKFYKLLKKELKLAFEPKMVASLDLKIFKRVKSEKRLSENLEIDTRKYLAEMYRLSELQAQKAAHLRALAVSERALAEQGEGDEHWKRAQDYLELYYQALKDRVA